MPHHRYYGLAFNNDIVNYVSNVKQLFYREFHLNQGEPYFNHSLSLIILNRFDLDKCWERMYKDYFVWEKVIMLNYFCMDLRLNLNCNIWHLNIEFINVIIFGLFYNVIILLKYLDFSFQDNLRIWFWFLR